MVASKFLIATLVVVGALSNALLGAAPNPLEADQTSLTAQLNEQIRRGDNGVFTGGKGVLVRNPLDDYEEMSWTVVPATFWVNDIFTSTQLYVTAVANNVDCPNDGTNGYYNLDACNSDPNDASVTGGWDYAALAYVIGTQMDQVMQDYDNIQSDDWGFGVFYPSDSNGVDQRCHFVGESSGDYDCPDGTLHGDGTFTESQGQLGAGGYSAGNPDSDPSWGGGTGCHFDSRLKIVDQTDAVDPVTGENLVQDYNCQCNYNFKTGDEYDWWSFVDNWINNGAPKKGAEDVDPWFTGGKAPNRGLDLVSCWVNNPRDMINIQNQFWWKREDWNNKKAPKSNWGKDPASHRVYWGWNEVPMANAQARDRNLRDAVVIRLPAAICTGNGQSDSPTCLSTSAQLWLERDIEEWVKTGHLALGANQVGQKPGSDVIWVKATVDDSGNWAQKFFCESWISPSNRYKVVFDGNKCYIDDTRGVWIYERDGSGKVFVGESSFAPNTNSNRGGVLAWDSCGASEISATFDNGHPVFHKGSKIGALQAVGGWTLRGTTSCAASFNYTDALFDQVFTLADGKKSVVRLNYLEFDGYDRADSVEVLI